ncbi:hypothetical protein BP00DRAFT_422144, partial [Aspergillus indologenus CBS 114.80]
MCYLEYSLATIVWEIAQDCVAYICVGWMCWLFSIARILQMGAEIIYKLCLKECCGCSGNAPSS